MSVDETLKQRNADSESDSGSQASGCSRLITDECDKDECRPIDQGVASFSEFRLSWGRQGPHHQGLSNSIDFKPEPVKARGLQNDEMQMPARAIIGFQSKLPPSNGWTRTLIFGASVLTLRNNKRDRHISEQS